jgi:hypothetical protein
MPEQESTENKYMFLAKNFGTMDVNSGFWQVEL